MAIFKNEHTYLEEWLDYHIEQGIEHFYLYSNDDKMENYSFLNNNKYKNFITIIDWVDKINEGKNTVQKQAYNDCIKKYNDTYEYIMMLDIDEFISPIQKHNKVIDVINSLDKNIKAVKVMRFNYGSNGFITRPEGNVMDNYKKREKICSNYKTIANSNFIDINANFYGVHDFPFINKEGKIYNKYFTYSITGFPNACANDSINEIPLIIKHYYTKSYEEYLKRCELWKTGGINNINFRQNCESEFKKADKNEISD